MKTLLLLLIISAHTFASNNIMILGDSHSVGPFGNTLFENLSGQKNTNVALYGHSSSSALHWVSEKTINLGGGVNHRLSFNGKRYSNPHKTHYKVKREVPKIQDILSNMAYHNEWKQKVSNSSKIDTVVVALGANDLLGVAYKNGKVNRRGCRKRAVAIRKMLKEVKRKGAGCIWIGPPNGISAHHTDARQRTLDLFLRKAVGKECKYFSSSNYKSEGCDGIHMSCKSQRPKAKQWATEATKFILKNTK